MTDDISKVVPPVHAVTFVPSFSEAARRLGMAQAQGNRPATAHWQGIVDAHEAAAKAALRLESATAPAEADGSEGFVPLPNIVIREPGPEADDHAAFVEHCADLLSKSGKRLTGRTLAESATLIRTLARQLAEAKAEIDERREVYGAGISGLRTCLAQAESDLAEATRRLGEVEGLVNDALALQQKHYGDGMDTHMALADWARNAKAAIDARLASDSEGGSDAG